MTLPKTLIDRAFATHYTLDEGEEWRPLALGAVLRSETHAVRYSDGREWDRINGWRSAADEVTPLKLDLGCGKHPAEGFVGVDTRDFGQDIVCDLRDQWKWEDGSVAEVRCSHFVEHLAARERIHFANELYRVLAPEGSAEIIVPHWASARAYGDLTHQWPPVTEFWFLYLSKSWREENAPHSCDDYSCDFRVEWGVSLDEATQLRNQEFQQFASRYYREAAQDIVSTWRKA